MIISLFLYILIILLIIFCIYKKRLHLFEIIFIGMTVWLITHSVSSIIIVNLKLFDLSKELSNFWTHFFKRLILYPLIIIIFFDLSIRVQSKIEKTFILLVNIIILSMLEFLFIRVGVLINHNFTILDSLLEWGFTVILTYFSWLWYRNKRLLR